MRRTFAFLLCAALMTQAAPQPQPYSTGKGRWEFICSDKKLVMVRVILIEPGEVFLPVPDDPCPNAPTRPDVRGERKT